MFTLVVKSRGDEARKVKYKDFQEAADHACMVIVPQISEAIEAALEQQKEDKQSLQTEIFDMLEIMRELYEPEDQRVEAAIERWAKLAEADNFGDTWVELV